MPVLLPESLDEACALLADRGGDLTPMAGGTDLMVHWPQRFEEQTRTFLDLSGVQELRGLRWSDGELVIGARATYWDVLREPRAVRELPLLASAARQVGAVQIQARGTWAGNVVNASPAADGVPVLMAYDAVVELASAAGTETVPLAEFYLGYKKMRRRPEQLVTALRIPLRPHRVERFEKVGSRRAQAITKVGFALAGSDAGWRLVVNSMAATVCRCPHLEARLAAGERPSAPEDLFPDIRRDVSPIDDIRSTARYRERVLANTLFHAWPT